MDPKSDVPVAQIEIVITQLMSPDTEAIKQAEQFIKVYWKHARSIPVFFQLMQSSQNLGVRQLATILLRKRISVMWEMLDDASKETIKTGLLQSIGVEPSQLVRRAQAGLVACVAKRILAVGQWNELLAYVQQCSAAPSEVHREMAFILLHSLTETIAEKLVDHAASLKALFAAGLQDANSKVRNAALKAAGALVDLMSTDLEVKQFRELVPLMLTALQSCVAEGEEDTAVMALEVFSELSESPVSILGNSLPSLVRFCMQVFVNSELDSGTRDAATMTLSTILSCKPKTIVKAGLVPELLAAMLQIMAESPATMSLLPQLDEMNDDDGDEASPYTMAQSTLDALAINLPTKAVFQPAMQQCVAYLNDAQSAQRRRAGAAALGILSEGLQELMADHLEELLPLLYRAAQDAEFVVREGAAFCLGQWSEYLQPHILDHHAQILPVVFALIDDPVSRVQGSACYVLESFCENMDRDRVLPYLQTLMQKLATVLQQTQQQKVQEMCIAAISATSIAAEDQFLPFFPTMSTMMMQLMNVTTAEQMGLRGRATECIGHMAASVGKDTFMPLYAQVMTAAGVNLQLEDTELHEYTFAMLCNISKILGAEFTPHLPALVPRLLEAATADDNAVMSRRGGDEGGGAASALHLKDDDEDSEDEEGGRTTMTVRTAMLDMKTAAVSALAAIAENTGVAFAPYLAQVLPVLMKLSCYFHDTLRESVAGAMGVMVTVAHAADPATPTSATVQTLVDTIVFQLLGMIQEDDEKTVASTCFNALSEIVGCVGVSALHSPLLQAQAQAEGKQFEPQFYSVLACLKSCFEEQLLCQLSAEEDEEDEEEGGGDHEKVVSAAAADLAGALARAMRGEFEPFFRQHLLEPVLRWTKGNRPSDDRSMAMGCFAEVIDEMKVDSTGYLAPLVPEVVRGLADSSHFLQRNTAFCAGVLVERCGSAAAAAPHIPTLLRALHPLFNLTPRTTNSTDAAAAGAVRDNAAAAVARMLMAPGVQLPLDQMLPVFLSVLPLQHDHSEGQVVYTCLQGLVTANRPEMEAHIPLAVAVMARALLIEEVVQDEEARGPIMGALRHLFTNFSAQMNAIAQQLTESERTALTTQMQRA